MKKIFITIITTVFLLGCQTADKTTKIASNVKGMIYNDIASNYFPRLTIISLENFPGGKQYLTYQTETYKVEYGIRKSIYYRIPFDNIDEHQALLEKFLAWNTKASSRKDMFTKEIGRASTFNGYSVFTFHSGNQHSNLLNICFSLTDSPGCSTNGVVFDVENVELIINDLKKFKSGSFKQFDPSIYN